MKIKFGFNLEGDKIGSC